jgi:hypothetical protein
MPISREEFKRGRIDLCIHIMAILELMSNNAFT